MYGYLYNILLLLSVKGKKILILQNALSIYVFPISFFRFKAYRTAVGFLIRRISKRNTLYIEVNDLLHEQAIDLGLAVNPSYIHYEEFIFRQKNVRFIFASQNMGEYVHERYGLPKDKYQVLINGAPRLKTNFSEAEPYLLETAKIRHVYAGTLNKGRQIEELIEIFKNIENAELILIGTEGEWINDLQLENIKYLGKFNEHDALCISAKCDVGVIPYTEEKFYYNICYPTKNSFYIAAGIPILSTPLKETMRVFENYPQAALFAPMDKWKAMVSLVSKDNIVKRKSYVKEISKDFIWDSILGKMILH